MKIRVTEVLSIENPLRVGFQTSVGSGTALWIGETPTIGEEQDVEFDLNEIFCWGKNLVPSLRSAPGINVINGVTQITAEIVQNAEEEWIALKLGDSLILIELDEPFTEPCDFVEARTTDVRLFPTNI